MGTVAISTGRSVRGAAKKNIAAIEEIVLDVFFF